jgi:azurin
MSRFTTLLAALALTACNAEAPPTAVKAPAVEAPKPADAPKPAEAAPASTVVVGADDGGEYPEVLVEPDGDQMTYRQTEITLKADTATRIKMSNIATVAAMLHNVVIVKKGSEDAVGQAALAAGEAKSYVPDHPDVLAATKMAKPGETSTVVVSLPAGEYSFICTFPGHYLIMRGTVKVEG